MWGTSDLELAYAAAYKKFDPTAAIKIVDLTIKMDHSPYFPEAEVTALYKNLSNNPFAQAICQYLASIHMLMYKVDKEVRVRMAQLFKIDRKEFEARVALMQQSQLERPKLDKG